MKIALGIVSGLTVGIAGIFGALGWMLWAFNHQEIVVTAATFLGFCLILLGFTVLAGLTFKAWFDPDAQ